MSLLNIPQEEVFPSSGNSYLKFDESNNNKVRIRLLEGPARYLVNTHFDENQGKKKEDQVPREYFDPTPENKLIKGVSLHWFFLVFDYADKQVKLWDIGQKKTIQSIISIGKEINLENRDVIVEKTGTGNGTVYTIMTKDPSNFDNSNAISEITTNPLSRRLSLIIEGNEEVDEEEKREEEKAKIETVTGMSVDEMEGLFE